MRNTATPSDNAYAVWQHLKPFTMKHSLLCCKLQDKSACGVSAEIGGSVSTGMPGPAAVPGLVC